MKKNLILFFFLIFSTFSYSQVREIEDLSNVEKANFEYSYYEGLRFKMIGDYKSAVDYFANCLKILPSSPAVQYELADIFLSIDDLNRALVMARNSVAGNSANIWYRILLANIYQKKSMIDEACKTFESIIELVPDEEKYYILEAGLYTSVEKWVEALSVYDKYENKFGVSEALTIEKLKLLSQLNDYKRSELEIKKLIKHFPDNENYKLFLAEFYFSIKDDKNGLKILNKLEKSQKDAGIVYLNLADYYYEKKNYINMNQYIVNGLNSNKIDADTKIKTVYGYLALEDTIINNKYIKSYLDILSEKHNDNILTHSLIVDYYKYIDSLDLMRKELEYLLSIEKNIYSYWESYLFLLNTLNDTETLSKASKEAINYFPDESIPYLFSGISDVINKKYNSAIPYFETGLTLENVNPKVQEMLYSSLADCYYNIDSIQKAFNLYDKILELNPNDASVLNNYAYYLSLRKENLSKAEKMASQAVTLEPENNTFLDTYAWVFFIRKNYSMALYYMKKIMENPKDDLSSIYYEHYGDILYMNKDKEQAMKMWLKAININDGESTDDLPSKINGSYKFD